MIIYGRNAVREALKGPRTVRAVLATSSTNRESWLRDVSVRVADADEIERFTGTPAHQGIAAEVSEYRYVAASDLLSSQSPFIVVLDQIQDPQNLGAICRTAECAGATGVVIPDRRASEVTGAVCKASAGAVEHLAIAQVRNISDFLIEAQQAGIWCYGASADGRRSYSQIDFSGGVALVLGSEGRGLRPRVAKNCDELVSIPQLGQIDSLNVSAAAAVLIYRVLEAR